MIYVLTLLLSTIGPFFWLLNNEVIFFAAILTGGLSPYLVAALVSLGSTGSFLVWYLIGKGGRSLSPKWRNQIDRIHLERFHNSTALFTFTAGAVALPPNTAVALLSGLHRLSLWRFVLLTFLGRWLRFTVMAGATSFFLPYFENSRYRDWIVSLFKG